MSDEEFGDVMTGPGHKGMGMQMHGDEDDEGEEEEESEEEGFMVEGAYDPSEYAGL